MREVQPNVFVRLRGEPKDVLRDLEAHLVQVVFDLNNQDLDLYGTVANFGIAYHVIGENCTIPSIRATMIDVREWSQHCPVVLLGGSEEVLVKAEEELQC